MAYEAVRGGISARSARRQVKKLSPNPYRQVQPIIRSLAENPRPIGYKTLQGKSKGLYRIDSGNYRIIYELHDSILVVLIVKVGDRRDVYR